MEKATLYEPLRRAPLKISGVFGMAWQLYQRGFWPMFAFSVLTLGVFTLICTLLMLFSMWDISELAAMQNRLAMLGQTVSMASWWNVLPPTQGVMVTLELLIVSLAGYFLLLPAYSGAVYMEMNQRIDGRSNTLRQLFRCVMPVGFGRFYKTYFAKYHLNKSTSYATLVFAVLAALFGAVGIGTINRPGINHTATIGFALIMAVTAIFTAVKFPLFTTLIYPVAVQESKYAADAIARSFALTRKHIWSMLAPMCILWLLSGVIVVLFVAVPVLLLWRNPVLMFIAVIVMNGLRLSLVMPYNAAFTTALYADCVAREAEREAG